MSIKTNFIFSITGSNVLNRVFAESTAREKLSKRFGKDRVDAIIKEWKKEASFVNKRQLKKEDLDPNFPTYCDSCGRKIETGFIGEIRLEGGKRIIKECSKCSQY